MVTKLVKVVKFIWSVNPNLFDLLVVKVRLKHPKTCELPPCQLSELTFILKKALGFSMKINGCDRCGVGVVRT
jgi:hypothetical protein